MKDNLLGPEKKGQLFIVSAPAGTGKTTLINMLLEEFPQRIVRSVTCTTRNPRKGEIEGKDYYFLSEEKFEECTKKGKFLEHATVFGRRYGTLEEEIQKLKDQGKIVILVIDTQGASILKEKVGASFIFIAPPSKEALEKRLLKRETETVEERKRRLDFAEHEIKQSIWYDYFLVNDDLNQAYQILKSIIIAEGHRLS